jgi:hypothetical protein
MILLLEILFWIVAILQIFDISYFIQNLAAMQQKIPQNGEQHGRVAPSAWLVLFSVNAVLILQPPQRTGELWQGFLRAPSA